MINNALFSWLHFLAAFGIVSTIFFEWQTMSRTPSRIEAIRLQRCDAVYGICAAVILIVGFTRVYYFEKGAAYYFSNPYFSAKLWLFALIGLLSIYPTVRFIKWRRQTRQGLAPTLSGREYQLIMWALRAELVLLVALVLCASLMARGIGS